MVVYGVCVCVIKVMKINADCRHRDCLCGDYLKGNSFYRDCL